MKKFFKRLFVVIICLALAFAAIRFGPYIYTRFFGESTTEWINEKFTETLKEKNELIVYQAETTGQETVLKDAKFIGTVQKVVLPYTFQISYTVDLSRAAISVQENVFEVRIPSPKAGYQKLAIDEDNVKVSDFFYKLTPERSAEIRAELEEKLFTEYSTNETFLNNAWDIATKQLETMFKGIVDQGAFKQEFEIRVVKDDTLPEPTAVPTTTETAETSAPEAAVQ